MGLDIYVGPLCRYYTHDWETIVQQMGRQQGIPVHVTRSSGREAPVSAAEALPAILAWRDSLAKSLAGIVIDRLDWNEDPRGDYFTDKPNWDCWTELAVFAAREEHPNARGTWLSFFRRRGFSNDPAYRASTAPGFRSRYAQFVGNVELWLPITGDIVFRAAEVTGNAATIGSVPALLRQLEELNRRTWRGDDQALEAWRQPGGATTDAAEAKARYAFAVVVSLARTASTHRLPMRLDY